MRGRVGATALLGSVVGVAMVLLGMEPRRALAGPTARAAATASCLTAARAAATAPADWTSFRLDDAPKAAVDWRVQQLRGTVLRSTTRRRSTATAIAGSGRTDHVVDSLVGIIDDLLFTEHGIDHAAEPEAAAAIVGPELAGLLADPAAHGSMSPRRLDHVVTLVERLSAAERSAREVR